jgi:hypothetical protein
MRSWKIYIIKEDIFMSFKKITAFFLATTMVLGSTFTAFAADTDPTGSGSGEGAGTSEGTVNTTVTKVIVPTDSTVSSALAFRIDPQRLIQETEAAAYSGYTFPDAEDDTGVYFLTGDKTYSNESSTFYFVNKGSKDVTFTLTAKVVANAAATDITLGSKADATAASPTAAKLYLGASFGGDAVQLATDTAGKKAVLAGVPGNFSYTWDEENGYQYVAVGNTWKAVPVKFEGAVTKYAIEDTATVPKLSLAWAWAAKGESDTDDAAVTVSDYTEGPSATPASMSVNAKSAAISGLGDGVRIKSAQVVKADNTTIALTATTQYTFTNNTFAIVSGKEVLLDNTKYQKFVLTFTDDSVVNIPIVAGE